MAKPVWRSDIGHFLLLYDICRACSSPLLAYEGLMAFFSPRQSRPHSFLERRDQRLEGIASRSATAGRPAILCLPGHGGNCGHHVDHCCNRAIVAAPRPAMGRDLVLAALRIRGTLFLLPVILMYTTWSGRIGCFTARSAPPLVITRAWTHASAMARLANAFR
jgi:hypothetical protein